MKHVRGSSFDRISELPSNIIEIILGFLPMQDAAMTSILSRAWKFQWAKVPQLIFDDELVEDDPGDMANKIFGILLLHQGPIFKFTLDMEDMDDLMSCSDIDRIIVFLSRNGIQELQLYMTKSERHNLSPFIFSCLQLRHLRLSSFVFKPPATFKGFDKLISLELLEVESATLVSFSSYPLLERLILQSFTTIDDFSIDAPNLKILCIRSNIIHISFIKTPKLAALNLTDNNEGFTGDSSFDLIKIFGCMPLIINLHIYYRYLKLLAVGKVSYKLPTVLNHLRYLQLYDISFLEMDEFSSALCLLRSCPNLQKLKFQVVQGPTEDMEPVLEYFKRQVFSDLSLNKLREVVMDICADIGSEKLRPQMEFIKLLLQISPELETIHIYPFSTKIDKSSYLMLIELASFPRASPKAKVIFPGPDEDLA